MRPPLASALVVTPALPCTRLVYVCRCRAAHYTQFMHLSVARLCLDCHEVHEYDRCPACTSEAFAFVTRWIKLENATLGTPIQRNNTSAAVEKIDAYRQILQPTASGSRAGKWLRNGGLLVAAGYVARWGWHIASRHTRDSDVRHKNDPTLSAERTAAVAGSGARAAIDSVTTAPTRPADR